MKTVIIHLRNFNFLSILLLNIISCSSVKELKIHDYYELKLLKKYHLENYRNYLDINQKAQRKRVSDYI